MIGLFLFSLFSPVFAAWDKKPEFRWRQLYRYDLRQDNHRLYTDRISLAFDYLDKEEKSLLRLVPFFEIRRNLDKDIWERKEAGIEIGKDIFPGFYWGEAIQKGWMKEDYRYYANYEKRDHIDLETRLCLNHNILSNRYLKLKGFILNEYTYDLDRGAGRRNEVVAGLTIPFGKYIETDINWRHIDRIHYYDSDVFEASITWIF